MAEIVHVGGSHPPPLLKAKDKRSGKRALVLGGGGVAGAAFEVGALLALNDVLSGFHANDFDIYVGTSAGAFLCSCLVNGISPEDFARSQIGTAPPHVPSIHRKDILKPVSGRVWKGAAAWAGGVKGTAQQMVRTRSHTSLVDLFFSLADDLKSSLYTTRGLEDYLRKLFATDGRTDRFDDVAAELYITATDIDTAERTVFGWPGTPSPAISLAVSASAAIPVIYEPVKIGGHEYLDGGLHSPTNLDIALAAGAELVVLINPLVPYLHDRRYLMQGFDAPIDHVSQGGLGRLISQVFRIMARSQLDKELEVWGAKYPNTDVLVIEPPREDEHLFLFNLMDYDAREQMAKDAFEQVAVDLVTKFPVIKRVFERAGISVSKARLLQQLQHVLSGGTSEALIDSGKEESA